MSVETPFVRRAAWRCALLACVVLVSSGCLRSGEAPPDPAPPGTSSPAGFPPGVYYARPGPEGARLARLDGGPVGDIAFGGVGFDVAPDLFVTTEGPSSLRLVRPGGQEEVLQIEGVFHVARPALSDDGARVVLQGNAGAFGDAGPGDLDVHMIDLATGKGTRLSRQPVNEESPEWVPGRPWVVWSSFDPDAGINAHVHNVETGATVATLPDAGGIHLAVSADGERLLEPGRMRVYALPQGHLQVDLLDRVLDALAAAGYEPDDRFPGQAGRGTFPLDGDFSPDGSRIVFDGAVRRAGSYGVIMAEIGLDGNGFAVLSPLLDVDPSWSNDHNFSQLNPVWI